MRFKGLLLLAAILVSAAARADMAPDFSLLEDSSTPVKLSEYRGQVVYVDFWASWCAPCRKSFPFMNDMHDRYAEGGLKVIAINLDQNPELAKNFISSVSDKSLKPRFSVVYDTQGEVAESYSVLGMPSSYLIDRHGKIAYTHIGFRERDKSSIENHIVELLDVEQ